MTIEQLYDILPMTERTLLKRMKYTIYPYHIANDRGTPCDYFIYNRNDNENPIGVVIYYKGRKLCLHGIEAKNESN